MSEDLKRARYEVACEIGSDIGSFTPPDEKRFIGAELMQVVAGAFLYGFFRGVATKLSEKLSEKVGEKIGEKLAESLWEFVEEARALDKETQIERMDSCASEINATLRHASLECDDVEEIVQTVETELFEALSEDAPADISRRIAATVRTEAWKAFSESRDAE